MTEPTHNQAPEGSIDDNQLNEELREAIQAKLRQEQEDAGEDMGDVSSISEAHSQFGDDAEEVADMEEAERAPTISELFAGENAVRIRISPRIMLNVAAQPVSDVPDVVRIGESFYSVASPLRKSKGKKIGSKSNPHGLIRDSLGELAAFVGNMQDSDVMLFGDTSDLETRVDDLVTYLDGEARNIMYGVFEEFADESTPLFSFRVSMPVEEEDEEPEAEDEDSLDNIGVTEVDATSSVPHTEYRQASDSFVVNSWPVLEIAEDGTLILRPTITININVPLLIAASDIVKPLASMSKIVANYAREAGLEEDDFRVTFAFDSGNLLDVDLLNLLQTHAAEDSDSVIISLSYLEQCVNNQANDVYRLFPTGRSVEEARNLLMSNGGDTLLLL